MILKIFMAYRKLLNLLGRIRVSYVTFAFLLVSFLGVSFQYVKLYYDLMEMKTIHHESFRVVQQVRHLKSRLAQVDKALNRLNLISSKLQAIAQVKERINGPKVAQLGFENLENFKVQQTMETGIIPQSEKIDLERVQEQLKLFQSEVDVQLNRYEDLEAYYDENKTLLASIPSMIPAKGYVSSLFGFRKNPNNGQWKMHEGVDIASYYGNQVVATADGLVEEAGFGGGYGRYVLVDHGFGLKTRYAHASQLFVKSGDFVKRGQRIASVGQSGHARGTHLHYEVRLNDIPLDPNDFIFN
ncbi:MAG: M23 family metallopeptidase [Deltaproteobacteria bacterium]|nr:M23 family metallopeptidase [Deltaproteobacteria bacterium]